MRQIFTLFNYFFKRLGKECKNRDHKSAMKIQKIFRGYICREKIKKLHRSAVIVQKHYRGFLGIYFQNNFPAI